MKAFFRYITVIAILMLPARSSFADCFIEGKSFSDGYIISQIDGQFHRCDGTKLVIVSTSLIKIDKAVYFAAQGSSDSAPHLDVTIFLSNQCDDRALCTFVPSVAAYGDPKPGVRKQLHYAYHCIKGPTIGPAKGPVIEKDAPDGNQVNISCLYQ